MGVRKSADFPWREKIHCPQLLTPTPHPPPCACARQVRSCLEINPSALQGWIDGLISKWNKTHFVFLSQPSAVTQSRKWSTVAEDKARCMKQSMKYYEPKSTVVLGQNEFHCCRPLRINTLISLDILLPLKAAQTAVCVKQAGTKTRAYIDYWPRTYPPPSPSTNWIILLPLKTKWSQLEIITIA